MSENIICDEILADANQTAKEILQKAKKEVTTRLEVEREKGRKKAQEKIQVIRSQVQKEIMNTKMSQISSAKIKAKWLILQKKQELIDQVLDEVKTKLLNLQETRKYRQMLEYLIIKGILILNDTHYEILVNERDYENIPINLEHIKTQIDQKPNISLKISQNGQKIDELGGIIIRTADKQKMIDYSFNRLLSNPDLRYSAAHILFPENILQ